MFCKECGSEIKNEARFCKNCGVKVSAVGERVINSNISEKSMKTNQVYDKRDKGVSRETYIGKAYIFDYYMGLNLRSFRLSRCATGFNDDHLLYSKGFRKSQIPYNMINSIYDEIKMSPYMIFCFVVFVILAMIACVLEEFLIALIIVGMAVMSIIWRNYRQISIVTTDNKVFKIKVVQKNKEIDQFLKYLKNETGIR